MASPDRNAIASMKADGRMCFTCSRPLDLGTGATAWTGGKRYCDRCNRPQKIGLTYKLERGVWHVNFLDLRSRLPVASTWRVQDSDKIREMIRRTPSRFSLADNQALDFGLAGGLGATEIEVTAEQLRILKRRK